MVVATEPDGADDLAAALPSGVSVLDRVEVAAHRLIVRVDAGAMPAGAVAMELRRAGWMALARPAAGAALTAWERDSAPVRIADRLTIVVACAEHRRHGAPGLVELGPGGFGNGHHPTTALLLEVVADRIEGGERVLDVGAGSGVLGLAALRLHAAELVAIDVKASAREATAANAVLNGFAGSVDVTDLAPAQIDGEFDLVLANIARDGIAAEAAGLQARTAGVLAVSGITPSQAEQVAGLLPDLHVVDELTDQGWAALVLARRR